MTKIEGVDHRLRNFVRVSLVALTVLLLALPMQAAGEERIVTLWGDLTEIMFGIGYGDRIVAVDATSNYPAEADSLPKLGFPGNFLGSAEAILAFEPTMVIAQTNARPTEVLDQLRAAGVEVVVVEAGNTLDSPANTIRTVAAMFGQEEQGERFVAEVEGKINEAIARGQQLAVKPRVAFVLFSSQRMQFIGGLGSEADAKITAAGGINAAAEVGFVGMMPYTVEGIVAAQPDVLIVTTRGVEDVVGSIEGILEWPGIAATPAGQSGNILVFEDLYFMGMGPRTGDSLLDLVEAFEQLQ